MRRVRFAEDFRGFHTGLGVVVRTPGEERDLDDDTAALAVELGVAAYSEPGVVAAAAAEQRAPRRKARE